MVEIWSATDSEGRACELTKEDGEPFVFSMVEGPFSGYPSVSLNRSELNVLRIMIEKALNDY